MIWKKLDLYENFFISEDGKLRNNKTGNILKYRLNHNGYPVITIRPAGRSGKAKVIRLHREVAKLFVPNPENKPEVNHKDCNKENNHFSNLEWLLPKENMQHAAINNRIVVYRGEENTRHKLTDKEVAFIRKNYASIGPRELGRMLDVSHVHIIDINKRKKRNIARMV